MIFLLYNIYVFICAVAYGYSTAHRSIPKKYLYPCVFSFSIFHALAWAYGIRYL